MSFTHTPPTDITGAGGVTLSELTTILLDFIKTRTTVDEQPVKALVVDTEGKLVVEFDDGT